MDAQRKALSRLSEDARDGFARVAAKGSFNKMQGKGNPFGGDQEGGNPFEKGGNPFQKGGQEPGNTRRQIPKDHEFDKKAVKPIVKTLWAMSVALGHALTAHRAFSRLKSSSFSPDGLLGGHGYVLSVKQIRQQLFESCEALSGLVDTLHDEINAPHWKPKIADLEKADMAEIERLLSDAEEWVDNPEEEVEDEQKSMKGNSSWSKDRFKKDKPGPGSGIPEGGDQETTHKTGPAPGSVDHPDMKGMKQSSVRTALDPSILGWEPSDIAEMDTEEKQDACIDSLMRAADLAEQTARAFSGVLTSEERSSVLRGMAAIRQVGRKIIHTKSASYSYDRTAAILTRESLGLEESSLGEYKPLICGNCGAERIDVTFPCENCGAGGAIVVEPEACVNCGVVGGYAKCGDLPCENCGQPYYEKVSYSRIEANSTVNPDTLPGPRIKHLDRADTDQTGPGGSVNEDDPVSDEWGESGGVSGEPMSQNSGHSYIYPSDYSGDTSAKWASQGWDFGKWAASSVPDSATESTPTQGFDFGIGDGNGNDAHGQGAGGYGTGNPGSPPGRGVYGPQAELPNDPGGKTKDNENSDSNRQIEHGIGNNSVPHEASAALPNDDDGPVARSDYYWGDKGNDFNYDKNHNSQSQMPGNNNKRSPAPGVPREQHLYEHEFSAGSEMPGDENAIYESAPGYGVDEYHRVEHGDQPYVKFDDATHNYRPDDNYQRGDLPAPYVNDDL